MRVKCITKIYITTTGPVFFKPYQVSKGIDDFVSFSLGTTLEKGMEYPLFIGAEYTVYGVMVHDGILYYLIMFEEAVEPDWIPSDLFEVTDQTIPCFWVMQTQFYKNDDILFILSHYEIATDLNHMMGLLQGYSKDFKLFQENMQDY